MSLHRVDALGAVGQLDVGQDQARSLSGDSVVRFPAGGGDIEHRMAEIEHQGLDFGGDHRFVLDDQHLGGEFGVDLRLGFGDQVLDLFETGLEDLGGFGRGGSPPAP